MKSLFKKDEHLQIVKVVDTCNACTFEQDQKATMVDGKVADRMCPFCGTLMARQLLEK